MALIAERPLRSGIYLCYRPEVTLNPCHSEALDLASRARIARDQQDIQIMLAQADENCIAQISRSRLSPAQAGACPGSVTRRRLGARPTPFGRHGTGSTSARAAGVARLSVDEIAVREVVQKLGEFIAMVQGQNGTIQTVRQGDKLADGTVRAINADGLVIIQEVSDPLSLVKQREVIKRLRSP